MEKMSKPEKVGSDNLKKPNILIFMTDHQRADMAPPFKRAITPNLDAFYEESVAFTKTYCPSPHCCPSRATFFSGLYPSQHGVWNNVNVGNSLSRGLTDGVRLWSEDLKDAGYHMVFTGKWHVSAEEGPQDRGFEVTYTDEHYTRYTGRPKPRVNEWKHYTEGITCRSDVLDKSKMTNSNRIKSDEDTSSVPSGSPTRNDGTIDRPGYPPYHQYGISENPFRDTTKVESAVKSIMERKASEAPWCHYVGTLGPHDPYDVPQDFLDMYKLEDIVLPENFTDTMADKPAFYRRTKDIYSQLSDLEHKKSIRHYLAFCSYEDHLFGQLVQALKDTGAYEDTVIVYTSDHGDYCGEHGLWAKGLPCFEGAYHVPLLIRHPEYTLKNNNPNKVLGKVFNETITNNNLDTASAKALNETVTNNNPNKVLGKAFNETITNNNPDKALAKAFNETMDTLSNSTTILNESCKSNGSTEPNKLTAGQNIEAFVSLADFAPTILEMAGVQTDRYFVGKSLMPFIKGEQPEIWRDTLFTQTNGNELYGIQRSVRTKDWKYVYNGFDYDELYDLVEDPNEMVNVFHRPENKEVIKEMCKRMWQFAYENDDVCVNPYIMTAQVPYGPGIIFE